jgi:hypothetical protein
MAGLRDAPWSEYGNEEFSLTNRCPLPVLPEPGLAAGVALVYVKSINIGDT